MLNNLNTNLYSFLCETLIQTIKCPIYIEKFGWEIISELGINSQQLSNYLHISSIEVTPLQYSGVTSYSTILTLSINCDKQNIRLLQQLLEALRFKLNNLYLESPHFRLTHGCIAAIKLNQQKNLRWEANLTLRANVVEKTAMPFSQVG